MKNYVLTLIISSCAFSTSIAQSGGIQFYQGTWSEVLTVADTQGKHIFVDAYVSWCGPCKMMDKYVFPEDTVGEFYNENFICYKLDMEEGEGVDFAPKYNVYAYPTSLYFNSEGKLVHRVSGYKDVEEFITEGKYALTAQPVGMSLDLPNQNIVAIYPNPTRGWITLSHLPQETAKITIYNGMGELVRDQWKGSNDISLDLSSLPNGLYFLATNINGQLVTSKIIKR